MARGPRATRTFEPILVEQGGEGGLAEFDLPQDAEQRGKRFLMLAGDAEQAGDAIRRCPIAGFGAGSQTEIDHAAARRGGKLEMRDLVEEDVGFGISTQRFAVPAEIERGAAG